MCGVCVCVCVRSKVTRHSRLLRIVPVFGDLSLARWVPDFNFVFKKKTKKQTQSEIDAAAVIVVVCQLEKWLLQ